MVDAWLQVGVADNLLKAQLDVVATANIATLPGTTNPFDFRSSASVYSVGVHFDSPLNREAERNVYRTSLINYQQARRTYMAMEDEIELQIRQDLRQLSTQKINFEINRQKLISAARLVESAREELLLNGDAADPTSTLNILTALNNVLGAKNGLIASWISYETTRIQLLLHLEELQLDERGIYSDEHNTRTGKPAPSQPNPVKQNAQTGSGTSPPASS